MTAWSGCRHLPSKVSFTTTDLVSVVRYLPASAQMHPVAPCPDDVAVQEVV